MKRPVLILFILTILQITVWTTIHAQTSRTLPYNYSFDSLVNVNEHYLKQDVRKLQLLNAITLDYPNVNPAKGIQTGEQAIVLAQKLNNKLLLAEAYNNKGVNHVAKSDYPVAMELYEKALAINQSLNNTFGIAYNTYYIGNKGVLIDTFYKFVLNDPNCESYLTGNVTV